MITAFLILFFKVFATILQFLCELFMATIVAVVQFLFTFITTLITHKKK